ncbi:Uncharacterised protein [Vibrio cholerae]|uniref:Uncharacterized protein n=1 Tax=Vibrio cholerae TaxID=666 RepID=A0A655YUN9_VIBCL|nr:Uncharacterised protein [Vibrio cholerae]CSC88330.1 Uncharacterised protein [Vibrio cholerae]CSI10354.1 Uncharacterised protein [Vibrio cholerae]CSI43631.1 Uncharacterised protein [Vibrio cholerae]
MVNHTDPDRTGQIKANMLPDKRHFTERMDNTLRHQHCITLGAITQ